ncbi:MAG: hypothetical protein MUE87_03530 [Methanothrix sp.]|nr:hypothetical protein [Methanothrix sp.]
MWRICLPCAVTTSGDGKKALQKAARAPWARRGGALMSQREEEPGPGRRQGIWRRRRLG